MIFKVNNVRQQTSQVLQCSTQLRSHIFFRELGGRDVGVMWPHVGGMWQGCWSYVLGMRE